MNKLKANIKSYKEGKRNFTVEELNEIKMYLLKYKDILENTNFYFGNIKDYKVVSCFAEEFLEELHSRMITNYKADIAIIVKLSSKKIIYKKNAGTCKIDLCKLAKILTNGECLNSDENSAIGDLTDNFINLTKQFVACS